VCLKKRMWRCRLPRGWNGKSRSMSIDHVKRGANAEQSGKEFLEMRDLLLKHRTDYERAVMSFQWPSEGSGFNWASDYLDPMASGNDKVAAVEYRSRDDVRERSYSDLRAHSNQLANFLKDLGLVRSSRILVQMSNTLDMLDLTVAAMKHGLVLVPCAPILDTETLAERIVRTDCDAIICTPENTTKVSLALQISRHRRIPLLTTDADTPSEWRSLTECRTYNNCNSDPSMRPAEADPLLLYFTSGTTSRPKLVVHTNRSYPVGNLSTMFWIGITPPDRHVNLSSSGWAKHAWSSIFAPLNASATVCLYNPPPTQAFCAEDCLRFLSHVRATTLCAPPSVWRAFLGPLQSGGHSDVRLREAVSAGEPLTPDILDGIRSTLRLTVRDGYGQTEITAAIGTTPGMSVPAGYLGRVLPGYALAGGRW